MKQRFLLLFPILAASVAALAAEQADTLFQAQGAKSILIGKGSDRISITVKDIETTHDNYYYRTAGKPEKEDNYNSAIIFYNITDISIIETDSMNLQVNFLSDTGTPNSMSFTIPDPENREMSTFIGKNVPRLSFPMYRKGKSRWSLISSGVGFGFTRPTYAPAAMTTSMGHSEEFIYNILLGVNWNYGHHNISSGIGFYGKNYRLTDGLYFNREPDGKLSIGHFDGELKDGRSRIQIVSLQVPLMYQLRFGHRECLGAGFGPIVNFNIWGNIKTEFNRDGRDYTIVTRHLKRRPVTLDLMATFNYYWIGLYARYSPMNQLRSVTSLPFQSFSTGVMLFF